MFGVVHNYADELSSGDHGVHLCSVLYTIMPMSLVRVFMVFTYVRCCTQLCRWTSSFVSPLLVCTSQCPGFVDVIVTPVLLVSTCKKSHVHLFIVTYSHMCPYVIMPRLCGCHHYNRAPGFHVQEFTRTFIYCNVLTHVSVRHNAPALWMASLQQGSWFPRARSHTYIYLL